MSNHLIHDTEQALRGARQLQERFARDPYRPRFHFLPPGGWLNDPNGALYWRGRYHLFYQYYPDAAYSVTEHRDGSHKHLPICWGHASSSDLIHWAHHPIALQPSIPGVDGDSCFSGHVVDNDGVATIIYFGVPGGSCIATSSDYRLDRWAKHPRAVIPVHGHMNWAGGQLNAPKSMLDGNGRRLMWGWVCEARTRDAQRAAGWAGILSLPRVLSVDAGAAC